MSFAGLAVDRDLRVQDEEDQPIQEVYAAGEVLGLGATGATLPLEG